MRSCSFNEKTDCSKFSDSEPLEAMTNDFLWGYIYSSDLATDFAVRVATSGEGRPGFEPHSFLDSDTPENWQFILQGQQPPCSGQCWKGVWIWFFQVELWWIRMNLKTLNASRFDLYIEDGQGLVFIDHGFIINIHWSWLDRDSWQKDDSARQFNRIDGQLDRNEWGRQ